MTALRGALGCALVLATPLVGGPGVGAGPDPAGTRSVQRFATAGSGTADDPWTGWEPAVEAGLQLHFSAGHYATASGLDLRILEHNRPSRTGITGDGIHSTFLTVTSPDVPALRVRGAPGRRPPLVVGFRLEGLTFVAGADNPDGALVWLENLEQSWALRDVVLRNGPVGARGSAARDVGIGLHLVHCSHGVIENLVLRSSRAVAGDNFGTGVRIHNDDGIQRGNNTFLGGLIQHTDVGVQIRSANDNSSNNNTFVNLKLVRDRYRAGTVGFRLEEGSWGTAILNTHVEGFATGIDVSAGGALNVIGGLFSFASDRPRQPRKAATGAAIRVRGNTLGVTIVTPYFVESRVGVLVEDHAARVTYLPGIARAPAGVAEWSEHVDHSAMAHTNRLGDEHPPHDLVNREIATGAGESVPAAGGKLLDLVARDAEGAPRWRARWQVLRDGLGLRGYDEHGRLIDDDGGGNLFVWNKSANRVEFDIDTRIGGNQAGPGIKLGVRGDTQIDGDLWLPDGRITSTGAGDAPAFLLRARDVTGPGPLVELRHGTAWAARFERDGDLRLAPEATLSLGSLRLRHDEIRRTLSLEDGAGDRTVVTASGTERRGVVLWGAAREQGGLTGDDVCADAGLVCVAVTETDGTVVACDRRPRGAGPPGLFQAYCR